jgi:arylsulfatase A-like enzyme
MKLALRLRKSTTRVGRAPPPMTCANRGRLGADREKNNAMRRDSAGTDTVTRRDLLLGGAAGALALAAPMRGRAQARAARPNIVFILADDFGYADASCYGRREYQTPNIDRIAADGMRFLQAYANSAVCSASRTAIITGRYQDRLAIGLEEPLAERDDGKMPGLPPGLPTLPAQLKKAGYATVLVGKWHLGLLPTYSPLKSGYDHFFGIHQGASDYFLHDHDLWIEDVPSSEHGYLTDLFGDHAVAFVQRYSASEQPFFLSLHFNAPHWPWEGPHDEAESKRLDGKLKDFDGGSMKTYAEMVTRMDLQIGRVLEALDAGGIADDTIVIFTSDNGGERYANRWPFYGMKEELLEGGLRIPAVIRWPGHVPAATTNAAQAIIHMDWAPTLLAAAGIVPDPTFPSDGMSLLPTLTANAPAVPRKLFWRYLNLLQEACRDGDWKYLKILDNTFLFNLADDPQERANLKDRHRDVYDRLVAEYRAWNATMLPLDPGAYTEGFTGKQLADHFGIRRQKNIGNLGK